MNNRKQICYYCLGEADYETYDGINCNEIVVNPISGPCDFQTNPKCQRLVAELAAERADG